MDGRGLELEIDRRVPHCGPVGRHTRSAAAWNLTQVAVSHGVERLETPLAVRFFTRRAKRHISHRKGVSFLSQALCDRCSSTCAGWRVSYLVAQINRNAAASCGAAVRLLKQKSLIFFLAGLAMLGPLSIDTYLPSFHSMSRDFGVGLDAIQQTLTVYLFAMAVMTLFHGTLSDAVGRRPVVIWSLVIYVMASLMCAIAPNLEVLLLGRLLQGLSAGAGMVVGRAMVRDLFEGAEAQRVMSYTTVVFGLAPVIAPILGGWLEVGFGWRSVFFFLVVSVTLLLACCAWKLPESLARKDRIPLHLGLMVKNYLRVGSDPRFLLQCLSIGLSSSVIFLYVSSAPVFMQHTLHLPETAYAWMFIPLISGIMGGSILSARIAEIWPPQRTIQVGFGILIIATAVNLAYSVFFTVAVPWAIIPLFVSTFGMALIGPAMTLDTLDLHPTMRGLTSSFQSAFVMMTFSLFAGLLAPLLFHSPVKLAVGTLISSLVSAGLWSLRRFVPVKTSLDHEP